MLETNRPVVLTFPTFFMTLNPINSRRKVKGQTELVIQEALASQLDLWKKNRRKGQSV